MKDLWKKHLRNIILPAIIAILGSYTGYNEYQKTVVVEKTEVKNEIAFTIPESNHPDVQAMIDQSLKDHKANYH